MGKPIMNIKEYKVSIMDNRFKLELIEGNVTLMPLLILL